MQSFESWKETIAFIDGRKTKITQKKFIYLGTLKICTNYRLSLEWSGGIKKNCYIWNVLWFLLTVNSKLFNLGFLLYMQVFNSPHILAIILWSELWEDNILMLQCLPWGETFLLHAMYGKGDPLCWHILPSAISGNKFDFNKVI